MLILNQDVPGYLFRLSFAHTMFCKRCLVLYRPLTMLHEVV
nr:MAG TPA: hypothetical protein [Crassvirales sp.]